MKLELRTSIDTHVTTKHKIVIRFRRHFLHLDSGSKKLNIFLLYWSIMKLAMIKSRKKGPFIAKFTLA